MEEPKNTEIEIDLGKFDTDDKFPEFKGWEAIGFHRPLANELWEIILELINNALYIFILAYLVPLLRPFPEIEGYRGLANGIFVLVFTIFDTGTNFGLDRFIAEYRVKNPRKMMEYVNFFIRYQMITGLLQVTIISYYIFEVLIYGNYGYLAWIILLEMQKQFPGMLGIFKSVISGMQHFSAVQMMNWIQSKGIEMVFNILFILWGRYYGETHPEMGIILAMAIWGTLGNYIDDVIISFVSAYVLNNILKKSVGFSLSSSLRVKIGKDVKQNAIKYGVPGSIIPIISSAVGTFILLSYSTNIPGYVTWSSLVAIGFQFSGIVGQTGDFALGTNVAEAFMSGKKKLAEFYVSYSVKWRYLFRNLLGMTIIAVIPYFYIMIEKNPGLAWYEPAFFFLVPCLIKRMLEPIFGLVDPIMVGAKKLNQYNIIRGIEEGLKVLFVYLWIFVFEIQNKWGVYSIIILLVYRDYIAYLIKTAICAIYIKKYILTIKIYWMPAIIIPLIASLPSIFFARVWLVTGFPPLLNALGFDFAVVLCFFAFFFVLIFTYFPLTVLLGGWDDYQLFTFQKAVKLSGPSKIVFVPVFKLLKKCANIGKKWGTHGRFSIPHEEAHKQILELMELKREHLSDLKGNL